MADLSVLIPARNEEWLGRTVDDVLAHSSDRTEVIVVLDGAWPVEPLPQHPRVSVLYHPVAIGQRAATNHAARISTARYVMKLDAHCSVADGFDVVLLDAAERLPRDTVQVPAQKNLHIFNWVCACGWHGYQGPTPAACPTCGGPVTRDIVWRARRGTTTTAWRFDSTLHFQYWKEFEVRDEVRGDLTPTMSLLGACWCVDRAWWLEECGGLDEGHGSWGNMGTEVACKAWLSGGQVLTNRRTHFAHLFRTQGGDFSFPYPLTSHEQERAREYSRQLWTGNRWPGQVRPLRWLVDRFWPVPGWEDAQRAALAPSLSPSVGVLYYSDGHGDQDMLRACRAHLRKAAGDLPIVAVTLAETEDWGADRIVLPLERGYLTMARQILAGLERLTTDVVFFAEHDVLYPSDHFTYRPPTDVYAYNTHVWKVDMATGRALHYRCEQLSGLCADRRLLLDHFRRRVARLEQHGFSRRLGFEPGKPIRHGGLDDVPRVTWHSVTPLVDIRHGQNLTPSRWRRDQFRNPRYTEGWTEADTVPGWGQTVGRFPEFLQEMTHGLSPACHQ